MTPDQVTTDTPRELLATPGPLDDGDQLQAQLDAQLDQGDDQPADPWDPMDELTLAELDAGSRLLKASITRAITEQTVDHEKALAVVGYLVERKRLAGTGKATSLSTWLELTYRQLHNRLETLRPDPWDEAGPTAPRPA